MVFTPKRLLTAAFISAASLALQQPCLCAAGRTIAREFPGVSQADSSAAPDRMNRPITSYPSRLSR